MPPAVLKIFSTLLGGLMKALPFLAAFKVSEKKVEAEVIENSVKEQKKGDEAVKKVKTSVRKTGVADHVRNNKI